MAIKSIAKIILGTLLLTPSLTFAAACCGGGASLPNLITGDYRGKLSFAYGNSSVTHMAGKDGEITDNDKDNLQVSETITLSGAYQFDDLWQVGIQVPLRTNSYTANDKKQSASGLGSVKLQTAFEFLPEYSYSVWKPRGFIFLQHALPSESSIHESQRALGTDSFGKGFHTTSLGFSFVKVLAPFDFSFMGEVHKGFEREFKTNGVENKIDPRMGHSFLLGFGHSPKNGAFRYGANLVYSFEEGNITKGKEDQIADSQYYWEGGINLSYMHLDHSFVLSLTDQNFFRNAKNTSLSQAISFSVVRLLEL